MFRQKPFLTLTMFSLAVAFGIGTVPLAVLRSQAESLQTAKSQQIPSAEYLNTEFKPPKRGAPPQTSAGGSRGCNDATAMDNPITALVPKTPSNNLPQTAFALTSKGDPTFFWYIPETIVNSAASLKFKLRDKDAQDIAYEKKFAVPSKSGIINLQLPTFHNGQPLLKAGEKYQWYLVAVCDEDDPSGDSFIQGWIERVDATSIPVASGSNLAAALQGASDEKRFSLYAQNGIWHETLETLVQLRRRKPEDATIRTSWDKLLNSVGLGAFSRMKFEIDNKPTALNRSIP